MKKYKNVLLALELEPESDIKIMKKAKEIVEQFQCKLWLVHSVEHLNSYGAAYGVAAGIDVEGVLKTEAEQLLDKIAGELNVPDSQCLIIEGPAKHVILAEADKIKADLIIVGSHGRHGVQLLLGSTANAILHGAKCDVLAVRVTD
ncbi:MAG: universal stress protein UspA [Coxiella sp. (in: Bacteria)]|nr:MAG: universal stress protein UspA [Coxiella sp. (in: g-proteobacteria)]